MTNSKSRIKYYQVKRRTVDWVIDAIEKQCYDDAILILKSMVDDDRLLTLAEQRKRLSRLLRDGSISREEYLRRAQQISWEHP